jgi:short-subunit dehydrogenase
LTPLEVDAVYTRDPTAAEGARPTSRLLDRHGPCALVTGASEGIGAAFAHALAAEGFALLLVARREEKLQALASKLGAAHGVPTRFLVADLATPDGIGTMFEAAKGEDVGLLVAAADFGTSGAFLASDLDAELAMLDVNCGAVLALTHRFGQGFADRQRGGIVLFSSLVTSQGVPCEAHYAATKDWVQSLADPRLGLTEVALAVGYASQSAFGAAFRRASA